MNSSTEYFQQNGYVVLKDAITRKHAQELTKYMFDLYDQGKLTKDKQCPLSDAVYGDPVFDRMLQDFADPIGKSVGLTLLPTYTYARIYRPGEVLKKHKDRPACEISATLTLGFDDKPVWPIFFDEDKEIPVALDAGELAVYRGCDILHWRPEFKGQWHVQVFLHYVDANGPYRDHYKDKREEFGILKGNDEHVKKPITRTETKQETTIPKPKFNTITIKNDEKIFPGYFCIDSQNLSELKFTKEECERIIGLQKKSYPTTASIGGDESRRQINKSIRSAHIFHIENTEKNQWIYEKIANAVAVANKLHFDYEISGIVHELQLIEYSLDLDTPGHYDWHIDSGNGEPVHRKISVTVQLSDPRDYKDCELVINNHAHEVVGTKEQGSIHLFPSYMLHKVTPVSSGVRYALVIWIHGSRRFR